MVIKDGKFIAIYDKIGRGKNAVLYSSTNKA